MEIENKVALPFKDAFFRTFIAYNWPASGPTIFLTRNTWENRRNLERYKTPTTAPTGTFDCSAVFPHLAKRALAEDFEQFKLRWISFLTALFHMVGDRNLLICPFILHKQYQYETSTRDGRYVILHACKHTHMPQHLKPIITYTVWERLSLLHGLVHDLMPIDLQPNQQVSSEESGTVNTFTKPVHPCFRLSRTMTAAAARPHVWWRIQQMKSMSHMQ